MADEHNIRVFTAADIEKYHKGLLSSRERHALEKAALDDPFLAEALEGYDSADVNIAGDLVELKDRLTARTEKNKSVPMLPGKSSSFSWWKAAAMIVLVAGAGLLVYQLGFNKKTPEIAHSPAKERKNEQVLPVPGETVTGPDTQVTLPSNSAAGTTIVDTPTRSKQATTTKPGTVSDIKEKNRADDGEVATLANSSKVAETPVPQNTPSVPLELERDQRNKATESQSQAAETRKARRIPIDKDGDGVADNYDKAEAVAQGFIATEKKQAPGSSSKFNVFRGRVTDANNNILPFTNITNLEDTIGTYTDARGYFVLTSPDSILNVQVRSLGFETTQTQLSYTKGENKILLEEDKTLNARILDTTRRNINRSRHSTMTLEEPEPLDGWSNYDTYLVNNLKVPESFKAKESGGEVELSFEVDKNGDPVNITVKKSLCESCDREAIRLVQQGPKWKRKMRKGKTTVTVTF